MGPAVAADPAVADPGPGTLAAGPHHQQVTGAAGGAGQDRPRLAAPDDKPGRQIGRQVSPGEVQRVLDPLAGVLRPYAAQLLAGSAPVGQVTIGRQPGKNGHQGGIEVTGQVLGVAQCQQAAW
jgi:hypothetical protein